MSKKTSVRNYGRIQNLFRHSVVIKIAMFLCLIALSSGWRKADTLGAAIGIGQQLVPAVLDAQKANSKGNNNDARSENELKWIEHIKNNPDSAIYAIGEYSRVYGKERAYSDEGKVESILDAIQYPEFSEDLEHIPLHKEEFYSGTMRLTPILGPLA